LLGPGGGLVLSNASTRSGIHRFTENSFRLLGLTASATRLDVEAAQSTLLRAAKLGKQSKLSMQLSGLGPVDASESAIADAAGRLRVPAQRLFERLFWFNDASAAQAAAASVRLDGRSNMPAVTNQALHDSAVAGLLAGLKLDSAFENAAHWVSTIDLWVRLNDDPDYWDRLLHDDICAGFEPPASRDEIESIRGSALRLALDDLRSAAARAAQHPSDQIAIRAIHLLQSSAIPEEFKRAIDDDFAIPLEEQLERLCREISSRCREGVRHDNSSSASNLIVCKAAVQRFDSEVFPLFERLGGLVADDHAVLVRCRGELAKCLSTIATSITWADEFVAAEQLLDRAKKYAQGTPLAVRIDEELSEVAANALVERTFRGLQPIDHAPSLYTLNGFGVRLYGRQEDGLPGSYLANHYLCALYIPLFPLGRYRVRDVGGKYQFLGKVPLRPLDQFHRVATLIAAAVFIVTISSSTPPSTPPRAPGVRASDAAFPRRAPQPDVPPMEAQNPQTRSHAATQVPVDDPSTQLQSLKLEIERGRAAMEVLKNQIQIGKTRLAMLTTQVDPQSLQIESLNREIDSSGLELDSLKSRLDRLRSDIDFYESQQALGAYGNEFQYRTDIDDHNRLVREYNSALTDQQLRIARYNSLLRSHNAAVAEYEDERARHNAAVDQYNAMLETDRVLVERYNRLAKGW
jgi:hypothetical protein